jgi:hypothetical protein
MAGPATLVRPPPLLKGRFASHDCYDGTWGSLGCSASCNEMLRRYRLVAFLDGKINLAEVRPHMCYPPLLGCVPLTREAIPGHGQYASNLTSTTFGFAPNLDQFFPPS